MGQGIFVIFNPKSGKGRGARLVQPVLSLLRDGGTVEHAQTSAPGEEGALAARAVERGFRTVVAVGGDGTWGNVGHALIRTGQDVCLGLIAGGTGCDLAKSLGVPGRDVRACTRIIREGYSRRIDVGHIEDRHFLNVLGFGYDIAVIEDSWNVPFLSGSLLYVYCALRQIRSFPGFSVELSADGQERGRLELLMLVLANGRVFGGAFQIAPDADLADGCLDAIAFRNGGIARRLAVMARLLRGRHRFAPEVDVFTGKDFTLRFDSAPAYETDGEWNRASGTELHVRTLPQALSVLVPRPS